MLATGLSLLLGSVFLNPFGGHLQPDDLANIAAFAVVGAGIAWLGDARLRSQVLARQSLGDALVSSRRAENVAAQYRTTFEQAPVGIAHLSPAGCFLSVNEHLANLLGRSREDLLRESMRDILAPEDSDGPNQWSAPLRAVGSPSTPFEALGGHAKARLTGEGLVYRFEIPLHLFSQPAASRS